MKKLLTIILFFIANNNLFACPVCDRNKANILQGISHGNNPDSNWDYVIVVALTIIVLLTLFYSVKLFVKPNETNTNHIKYSILNE